MAGKIRNFGRLVKYFTDGEVSTWKKALMLIPVIYFITPFDLFPDVIFPIGYLEDAGLLVFAWQMVKNELDKYVNDNKSEKNKKKNNDNVVNLNRDDYDID